jgi:glucose/arabinose dehydrogenase/PKD repeat protein
VFVSPIEGSRRDARAIGSQIWNMLPLPRVALLSAFALALVTSCADDGAQDGDLEGPITLPPQFSDSAVADVAAPTALAFTPDGRLLIASQQGKVRVYKNGALRATAAIDLSAQICTNSERGVLGVAIDPSFATNHFVYLYYTKNKHASCATNAPGTGPVNRASRFTYDPATDTIDPASELVLVDNIMSLGGNHNGGDLHFGADGLLHISVGDSGCQLGNSSKCGGSNTNATYASILNGKILRVTSTGGIPDGNMFVGASGAVKCGTPGGEPAYNLNNSKPCLETFARGLRNPFRFAFKPSSNAFFINDVGQNLYEEIDDGKSGANYGWPIREGNCANGSTTDCGAPPAGLTNPLYAYDRSAGCKSITGAAFVPPGAFGSSYDGVYLFADYVCGKIFARAAGGGTPTTFAQALGGSSVVDMVFGPSPGGSGQGLYYTTYANGGQIRRVDFTGAVNRAPTAKFSASPVGGPAPLAVSFDGSGSSDPDAGDTLTYLWTFGDGQTKTTTTPTTSHTYSGNTNVTAQLVVKDNHGLASAAVTRTIYVGDVAPSVTISAPAEGATFKSDQPLALHGSATDAEDGALPASALSWTVLRHHADHTHPWAGPLIGPDQTIQAPPPEDLASAANSYLEVRLTATDSRGQSTTITRDVQPRAVALTFKTSPAGLKLVLDGTTTVTGPATVTSWEAWGLHVDANPQTDGSGKAWVFSSWSDGGAASHTITTPGAATTYTATFVAASAQPIKINFQPAGSPVPSGYAADSGLVFGARGGGLSFGWNAANDNTRDRDSAASPDQRYDTLDHMQKPSNPNASWELAVANGSYDVHVVMGDPSNLDSDFELNVEGVKVVSGKPSATSHWVEGTKTITVSDGRLTLTNATGAANNKVCFLEVTPH